MKYLLFLFLLLPGIALTQSELRYESSAFSTKFYEGERQIAKAQYYQLLKSNTESLIYYNKYKTKNAVALLATIGGSALTLAWLANEDSNSILPLVGGLGTGILGIVLLNQASNDLILATKKYNDGLKIGFWGGGIGIQIRF